MTENNKLYSPPSIPALTTYISVVVVLFLAGLNFAVFRELDQLRTQLQDLREETSKELSALRDKNYRLELSMATRTVVAPQIAATPVTAPAPVAPQVTAPQPTPPVAAIPAPLTPKSIPAVPAQPAKTAPETTKPLVAKTPEPTPVVSVAVPPMPAPPAAPAVKTAKVPEANPAQAPEEIMALAPSDSVQNTQKQQEVEVSIPPMPSTEIVPTAPKAASANAGLSAQLLATNPDQRRIIISVGSSNGVEKGQRFSVHRGNKWVGTVRTSRVFADMAMCDIVTPTPLGMRVGDIAKMAGDSSNP